jgi:sulfur relay (sulfurtransferase) DsrF/TusC family protein
MKTFFILNDAPYGTDRCCNALRLAGALSKRKGEDVRIFLLGDAAGCARVNQKLTAVTPSGCSGRTRRWCSDGRLNTALILGGGVP